MVRPVLVLSFIISVLSTFQCSENTIADKQYTDSINTWHEQRIKRLTSEDGWLSLAGLYWLEEGPNTFGAHPENDLVFPLESTPDFIGSFHLRDTVVTMIINSNGHVFHDSIPVTDSLILRADNTGTPTIISQGTLSWYVIKREERYGIRLKDRENLNLLEFQRIERFPVDKKWLVSGQLIPYETEKTIRVPTVLGTTADEPCPGFLKFKIGGTEYRLDPIADSTSKSLFVIFGDATNGESTYGAGRFLYVDLPDETGNTMIDFNKSYNPPCAFSAYATCHLPPLQNRLAVEIQAGEKKYGRHHH
jgi:uncharacterized protein (DUF1684 family)